MKLHITTPEEILAGKASDIYFHHTAEVLKKNRIRKKVKAEFAAAKLPYPWAVFAGLEEVQNLLASLNLKITALPEGTIFKAGDPVLTIEGQYLDFGIHETAILGLICQASGVATQSARIRKKAGTKQLLSFGARRMHPSIAPMLERSAFIGGCDGVSVIKSAELLGITPSGTMPHALILQVGDEEKAFKLFDKIIPKSVKRIALVDTFLDEKFGALTAARLLKKGLYGVRLDTPSSRKGDFRKIVEEVRWELDLRGFGAVKIFVSGGLGEEDVERLVDVVDGFGVGTAISNARVIDFSMDIVEINGKPMTKRGKKSGKKKVFRCFNCLGSMVVPARRPSVFCQPCKRPMKVLTRVIGPAYCPSPQEIRQYLLRQLQKFDCQS